APCAESNLASGIPRPAVGTSPRRALHAGPVALQVTPVLIIGSTGALGRNHRRAHRRLRGALSAESWTIRRLFQATQDHTTNADRRFVGGNFIDLEKLLRVVGT